MKVIKSIKSAFGKSFCNICLSETKVTRLDNLDICVGCLEKVKSMQNERPFEITKEQKPGGIKDEL